MGILTRIFGGDKTESVPKLLRSLGDSDVGKRLQAVTTLGAIGLPRTLGPLLLALRDKDETVRTAAMATLEAAGVDRNNADRVTMIYQENYLWKKGVAEWRKRIGLISGIMNMTSRVAGTNPDAVFGGSLRNDVGFLFDDKQKAIEAALETGQRTTVFIWLNRAMAECEFGYNPNALKIAARMREKGARAIETIRCEADIAKGLAAIFKS